MADQLRIKELSDNYRAVNLQIENICKEANVKTPRLIAVSKYKPAEDIKALYDLGHRHFGENYVQELTEKVEKLPKDIKWHFIGSLQSNKCKVLAPISSIFAIQTLDSESKAKKLNQARSESDPPIHIYIQINTSGEENKSGIEVSDLEQIEKLANFILENCPRLKLEGLMTIGSLAISTGDGPNTDFTKLVFLKDELKSRLGIELELSMGMSNDYIEAIRQGSTNVRVGSAIFGSRKSKEEMAQHA